MIQLELITIIRLDN